LPESRGDQDGRPHRPLKGGREKDIEIAYLADHEEAVGELAQWFHGEWSYLYPDKTMDDVKNGIAERTNRDCVPMALVALEGAILAGTVCLKTHDMDTRLDLSPWLAGLYVAGPWRGRGIGTALVKAVEQKAIALGIRRLYLYTPSAEVFYLRMAWRTREATEYHGTKVTIMEKEMYARE
jgi:GNAT superfamily N-acetyltransferase